MRKILSFLALLFTTISFSQFELSADAKYFKESQNVDEIGFYNQVRSYAIENWNDNHVMIVSEINQNVSAFVDVFISDTSVKKAVQENPQLLVTAIKNWAHPDDKIKVNIADTTFWSKCRINWMMVKAEIEQQYKASISY